MKLKIDTKKCAEIYNKCDNHISFTSYDGTKMRIKDTQTLDSFLEYCQDFAEVYNTYFCNRERTSKQKFKEGGKFYVHITPSRSGMSRVFSFDRQYNIVINAVHHNKLSFEEVRIGGCGMDMLWYTLWTTIKAITKDGSDSKFNLNATSSYIAYTL